MIDDNGLIAAIKQETEQTEALSYDGVIRSILANNTHTPWTAEQCKELTDTYPNLPPVIASYLTEVGTTEFHIKGVFDSIHLFCPVAMKDVMSAQEQLSSLVGVEIIGTGILYLANGLFIDLCGSIVGKYCIFAIDTKTGPYVVFDDFTALLQWLVNNSDKVVDYTQESEEGNEATSDVAEDPGAEEAGDTATDSVESVTEPSEAPVGDSTDSMDSPPVQGSTNQSLIQQMLINKYTWKDVQAEYDTLADFLNALLQDATLSQENCVGCGTTTTVSTVARNLSNGTNVVNQGGYRDGAEYRKGGEGDGDLKFSYNKGENTKEIVQLTGPLSEIYTRALNIYYRKKPAFDEHTVPEDITQDEREQLLLSSLLTPERTVQDEKVVKADSSNESAAQDDAIYQAVVDDVVHNEIYTPDNYVFVNDNVESPEQAEADALVHIHTVTDALKPEVIDVVNTDAEKNKNVVLVVTNTDIFDAPADPNSGTKLQFIDTEENETYHPSLDTPDLEGALESLYAKNGIKYVKEFSGFIKYLNNNSKKWQSKGK